MVIIFCLATALITNEDDYVFITAIQCHVHSSPLVLLTGTTSFIVCPILKLSSGGYHGSWILSWACSSGAITKYTLQPLFRFQQCWIVFFGPNPCLAITHVLNWFIVVETSFSSPIYTLSSSSKHCSGDFWDFRSSFVTFRYLFALYNISFITIDVNSILSGWKLRWWNQQIAVFRETAGEGGWCDDGRNLLNFMNSQKTAFVFPF